jgi:hypothetical protein
MEYILGVDLGTSSLKCLLMAADGSRWHASEREYPIVTPHQNWAEQEPEAWWHMAVGAIREVVAQMDVPPAAIKAIGLSGQMHGTVFLGANRQRPCATPLSGLINEAKNNAGRCMIGWVSRPWPKLPAAACFRALCWPHCCGCNSTSLNCGSKCAASCSLRLCSVSPDRGVGHRDYRCCRRPAVGCKETCLVN